MNRLSKETLEYLSNLARVANETNPTRHAKLLDDLVQILGHFEELQGVDTAHVAPMTGGTMLSSIVRADVPLNSESQQVAQRAASIEQFPEREHGYLKVPPVFGD